MGASVLDLDTCKIKMRAHLTVIMLLRSSFIAAAGPKVITGPVPIASTNKAKSCRWENFREKSNRSIRSIDQLKGITGHVGSMKPVQRFEIFIGA